MSHRPHVESAMSHGGDRTRVAAWVLDCLDRHPPPPGGDLTVYVCYHSGDINCFGSASRDEELVQAIYRAYLQEKQWDNADFGDLRFDLRITQPAARLLLALREGFGGFDGAADSAWSATRPHVDIEFCWQQADLQVGPGTVGLVQCWRPPLAAKAELAAMLRVESAATIPRHIDRWQRGARWQRPEIYLPIGQTTLSVGPWVGCDLLVPELRQLLLVSYDSYRDEWRWRAEGGPDALQGYGQGQMRIDHQLAETSYRLTLSGQSLATPRNLETQEEANRLPLYSLDIVGFALPLGQPNGYGVVPEGLPAEIAFHVSSGLRLPNGAFLYEMRDSKKVYLYDSGDDWQSALRSRPLVEGHPVELRATTSDYRTVQAVWQSGRGLPEAFRGELTLEPALDCLLSRGVVSEDVPEDFFPAYQDVTLGRAPLRLETRNGWDYSLIFNETARHPVYVRVGGQTGFLRYSFRDAWVVPLVPHIDKSVVAEFILGSTHYQLHEVADARSAAAAGERSFAPVGGTAWD